MSWFNDISMKKIAVAGQVAGDEYIIAIHNPDHFNYGGIYTVSLTNGTDTYQFDLDITGSTKPIFDAVSCKVVNIMATSGAGISDSLTDLNNAFDFAIVDGGANRNFVTMKFKVGGFLGGNFDMSITNKIPSGMHWTSLVDYLGKDYSTVAGSPFGSNTLLSPLLSLGGGVPAATAPTVTTSAATVITGTTFTINGNLGSLGSAAAVELSVWYRTGAAAYTKAVVSASTSTLGAFSKAISGLNYSATYDFYVKAVDAGNPANSATGATLTATTLSPTLDANSFFNFTGTVNGASNTKLDSTTVTSDANGSVSAGMVTATANNNISNTIEVAQAPVGDPDFAAITPIFTFNPFKLTVHVSSTAATPVFTSTVAGLLVNGSKLWRDDGVTVKEIIISSVTETTIAASNTAINTDYNTYCTSPVAVSSTTVMTTLGVHPTGDLLQAINNGNGTFTLKYNPTISPISLTSQTFSFPDTNLTGAVWDAYDLSGISGWGIWMLKYPDGRIYKYVSTAVMGSDPITFGAAPTQYTPPLSKYTINSHTPALTNNPSAAYKAGQEFKASTSATSGSPTYVACTLGTITRSGDALTYTANQMTAVAGARYVQLQAKLNKGDICTQYKSLLYV